MTFNLTFNAEYEEQIISLLEQNEIQFDFPNLLEDKPLHSGFDLPATISIVIDSVALLISFYTLVRESVEKTNIGVEIEDKENGISIRFSLDAKNADERLKKVKKIINSIEEQTDAPPIE